MTIPVLVNRGGGAAAAMGDALRSEIEAAFAAAGLAIELHLLDGADIAAGVRRHAAAPLIVVGGGDGTIGAAVGVLPHGATLAILPLGTLNHLARELGVPLDLPGAARLIAARSVRRIDIARVSGRVFLNNASIGLYPEMVRRRDTGRRRMPKWIAAIPASWAAFSRLHHHRLHLCSPGRDRDVVTPMLFVGNNHYALEAGQVGTRSALDDGTLSVIAVAERSRLALLSFAVRTVLGRAVPAEDFAALGDVATLRVSGRSSHIDVALDGEVVRLAMPLDFTIDARALAVVAPAPAA